jgi:DNA-directed RNA polymerase specialized sigma24 family protein
MASQEQFRALTESVLEAVRYQRWCGANDNPALGRAIPCVDRLLLPWARQQIADLFDDSPPDAENLVADAGVKAILGFPSFNGITGAEFYRWVEAIVAHTIADLRRLREARRNGGLRRAVSLERSAEAARLTGELVSPAMSAEEAAIIRESALGLHRAVNTLSFVQKRVVKLWLKGRSLREISAMFGHSPSWANGHWESAKQDLLAIVAGAPARQARAVRASASRT